MLSIIIPTLNEGGNLERLISKIVEIIKRRVQRRNKDLGRYEIIVVDDNSQDGTDIVMKKMIKKYSVKFICRKEEKGLSSAVVKGFSIAKGDIFGVMDGDLSHPPELIPKLLKEIEAGNDIVIASRYAKGGGVERFPFYRQLTSRGATLLARPLVKVQDPMSGYFFLKRKVIDGVKLNPIGYKILLEILVKGKYQKYTEVPYTFLCRYVGKSKLGGKIYWHYIVHLFRLYRYVISGK